jgi:hypothetical protein
LPIQTSKVKRSVNEKFMNEDEQKQTSIEEHFASSDRLHKILKYRQE